LPQIIHPLAQNSACQDDSGPLFSLDRPDQLISCFDTRD
jgi:hypothetical protein